MVKDKRIVLAVETRMMRAYDVCFVLFLFLWEK